MSRIKILSENLANQIAAGEVVERPASVVKELVENALDAGASHIAVQVEGAGSRLLRVIDNGCGMDTDDALLCLERHATSKLERADDLVSLKTLGFRGEAIPSIASVSRLTITSRPAGAELGCRVDVRFGTVSKVHEMGCAQGTVVEVADLFANVPARRKFLKSANTELAHIDEVVRSYALACWQTGFTYQVNGRDVFDLACAVDTPERRAKLVLGDCPDLIPLAGDATAARAEIQVSGYLVPPEQGSGRAARLWIFVNGRYVKDKLVNHAMSEGLQGFLTRGGRAAGVVHVSLPPSEVDVNVHPTKQEVRFSESNLVHNKIVAAVWRSMEAYQERLKGQLFGAPRPLAAPPPARETAPAPMAWPLAEGTAAADRGTPQPLPLTITTTDPGPAPMAPPLAPPPSAARGSEPPVAVAPGPATGTQRPAAVKAAPQPPTPAHEKAAGDAPCPPALGSTPPKALPATAAPRQQASEPAQRTAETSKSAVPPRAPMPPMPPAPTPPPEAAPLHYLGQLHDTYLLCQSEDGLLVIDQHAAQERLIFEDLKRHYGSASMPCQILMFPELVELLPVEIQALSQHGEQILRLGLELQDFGGDTVLIKAVPAGLGHLAPADILRGILGRFIDEPAPGQGQARLDEVLASMACKAAIKAGHRLTPIEVKHLLHRMQTAGIFSHCPHGRPVFKRFSSLDIERWFQRT